MDITDATHFTVALNATDQATLQPLLNANGTTSTGGTTYNLAAAEDWAAGAATSVSVVDATNALTISSVPAPTIASATYDTATGQLVVTGTGFLSRSGSANDIDVSKLTITGEGGSTYTLTSGDVDITNATHFTVALNATDQTALQSLLNANGTTSTGGTTYNLAAAEDWAAGAAAAVDVADATGNGITVSGLATPTITSATYNAETGVLVVTGTEFLALAGADNDIDASKLTITGEGGVTYTLTDTVDVEIDSVSQFTLALSATDRAALDQLLNKDGTVSTGGTTYNLAAADNWDAAVTAGDTAAATNALTISNVPAPTITSATYDASTGQLVVTGTGFLALSGSANDIDVSKLTITGDGGTTYTLTSDDVDITNATHFTVALNATDQGAVQRLLNANGTASSGGTTYNLAAAEDWAAGAAAAVVVADATGNGITVSGVPAPTIASATYDTATGQLVVTGTDFLSRSGSANDIDVSKLTITGEGGTTYTLTSGDVDITDATHFTVALNAADQATLQPLLNANGTTSTGGTTYNLAAAEDWAAGAAAAVVVADETGNGITVSGVAIPTITSATYNATTGVLVVTGTGFLALAGADNDIDASKLTITGAGGAIEAYTLTDTADVDVTSATHFSLTLSATDKEAVNLLLNKDGTSSEDSITYNLAAAEGWAAGAANAGGVADTTGNGITVTLNQAPVITSDGGGATASVSVAENSTAVATVTATDADAGDTPTYAIAGGADQALFTINSTTGALAFLTAPNFESPTDNDTDNVYHVVVSAGDGHGGMDTQSISVTVTDVAEGGDDGGGGGGGGGGSTDTDNDGVSSTVENQVPGLTTGSGTGTAGDGNGDGQPDSQQNDVCSVGFLETPTPVSNPQGAPTAYITLVADSLDGKIDTTDDNTAVLEHVQQRDAPADKPSDVLMPFGLLSFTADVGNAGETETFSLYVDGNVAVNGYWKQTVNGSWVNLASAAYGGQVVQEGGKTRLDFSITDGGEFDSDGVANGVITDPGGIGWRDQALVFDEAYYLASKLAQLQASGYTGYTTTDQVKAAIEAAGLTCAAHYQRYSLAEGTDPDAFFDTNAYLSAKAAQLNAIVYEERSDWSAAEVKDCLAAAGFTNAYDHFAQYGWLENVDPSGAFDVSAYLATKAAQCGMSVAAVTEAFQQAGLDPISHYALYGQNESGVTVSAVSSS